MSIESEIRELDIEQRKCSRYSVEWRKIEDQIDRLKRKRKRDEDEGEDDDNGDIAALATVGILDSLDDSGSSYSDSSSSVDFGGGDSGGGGFGGDF